jgi:hypothetical protein
LLTAVSFAHCCFVYSLLFHLLTAVSFAHCCFVCSLLFRLFTAVSFIHCCFIHLLTSAPDGNDHYGAFLGLLVGAQFVDLLGVVAAGQVCMILV